MMTKHQASILRPSSAKPEGKGLVEQDRRTSGVRPSEWDFLKQDNYVAPSRNRERREHEGSLVRPQVTEAAGRAPGKFRQQPEHVDWNFLKPEPKNEDINYKRRPMRQPMLEVTHASIFDDNRGFQKPTRGAPLSNRSASSSAMTSPRYGDPTFGKHDKQKPGCIYDPILNTNTPHPSLKSNEYFSSKKKIGFCAATLDHESVFTNHHVSNLHDAIASNPRAFYRNTDAFQEYSKNINKHKSILGDDLFNRGDVHRLGPVADAMRARAKEEEMKRRANSHNNLNPAYNYTYSTPFREGETEEQKLELDVELRVFEERLSYFDELREIQEQEKSASIQGSFLDGEPCNSYRSDAVSAEGEYTVEIAEGDMAYSQEVMDPSSRLSDRSRKSSTSQQEVDWKAVVGKLDTNLEIDEGTGIGETSFQDKTSRLIDENAEEAEGVGALHALLTARTNESRTARALDPLPTHQPAMNRGVKLLQLDSISSVPSKAATLPETSRPLTATRTAVRLAAAKEMREALENRRRGLKTARDSSMSTYEKSSAVVGARPRSKLGVAPRRKADVIVTA